MRTLQALCLVPFLEAVLLKTITCIIYVSRSLFCAFARQMFLSLFSVSFITGPTPRGCKVAVSMGCV